MTITKGYKALVDEAMAQVRTYDVDAVRARLDDPNLQLVDIRDVRELQAEGAVPGSLHAPRGMLEFWVDPDSPYFKPVFGHADKEYVLFCAGGLRSALAAKTLQDMGMRNVAHIEGGFGAWKKQGGPVETMEQRKAKKPA
jgi:rhodanese-related sulfurtransferase